MDDTLFTTPAGLARLANELLPPWMPHCRWFSGKARGRLALRIADVATLGGAWLLAVEATYADGPAEIYAVPLATAQRGAEGTIAELPGERVLYDATHSLEFRAALFQLITTGSTHGNLRGESGAAFFPTGTVPTSRVLKAEQSNTSLIYGERLFVKLYRRLVPGINPDAEITRFLSEQSGFRAIPTFGGTANWGPASLALAQELRANEGDAWALALREFTRDTPATRLTWLALAHLLGQRTGEMHCALATADSLADFAPEQVEESDIARVVESIHTHTAQLRTLLREKLPSLPPATRLLAQSALAILQTPISTPTTHLGWKTRTHGDYHLGQVLFAGGDFILIDFEGEPTRTLAERRAKAPPHRDVAGMLRSFHYAAHAACRQSRASSEQAEDWAHESQSAFLTGWRKATQNTPIAHADEPALLHLFLHEKALYEVISEHNTRPDWLDIPLRGLLAGQS